MAHAEHFAFISSVKQQFPRFFENQRVLDIGSLDINGNNQRFFTRCQYTGLDIAPGPNVNVVSIAHEYQAPDASFDVILSTNCFEHDMYYGKTLAAAIRLLRPSGLFVFQCKTILAGQNARTGEHGTILSDTYSSPFTSGIPGWDSYYRNLTEVDIRAVIDVNATFREYEFSLEHSVADIRFWGVKR